MMRPSLHLISERRRHRHGARDAAGARRPSGPARGRHSETNPRAATASTTSSQAVPVERDLAVQRVREAGGPVDQGFYSCSCGLMFEAPVSTTVACPHCGDSQAW